MRSEDDGYAEYDSGLVGEVGERLEASFWSRARNELILWAIRSHFAAAQSLLEVGCGPGIVLRAIHASMPDLALVGCDLDTAALDEARERAPDVEWLRLDVRDLPYRDRFDVAAALDVLEHLEDDRAALRSIHGSLRSGGGLIVSVPQHTWLWSPADDVGLHFRRYTRPELLTKMEEAGFEILRSTSFVTILLPLMLLQRLRVRASGTYDALEEFALPRAVDASLYAALKAESAVIRAGISLPVGGSLLAIARKPLS